MSRAYYSASVADFITSDADTILGRLTAESEFDVDQTQRDAWVVQIKILKEVLVGQQGNVYFEYSIPRMGRRIDVVLLSGNVVFAIEFKVGECSFYSEAIDQVFDYALDLKNFHETSHSCLIAPILVATEASSTRALLQPQLTPHNDRLFSPLQCNGAQLLEAIQAISDAATGPPIDAAVWENGRYRPTPTIIDAARALFRGHSVTEISRNDAGAINLSLTTRSLSSIIESAKSNSEKTIVFVTGVPGAGKTLVGLNVATQNIDTTNELYSVFLSGNGPLVVILREALARDKVHREAERGRKIPMGKARSEVKAFIQNVHNFRDEYIRDRARAPFEHVALFDEAQRAWTLAKTADFMKRKKKISGFSMSEPEFLISCLDRHKDWAVVVCLVGGGQEIHTGEAGIGEWITTLKRSYPRWNIFISSRLTDEEYGAGSLIEDLKDRTNVHFDDNLHLAVSMRSFRAENVSLLVKQVLDLNVSGARQTLAQLNDEYPIVLTRNPATAKRWLKRQARGSERYGIVVSSYAERLRAHGMFVKAPMDPVHWFLDGKDDVRSSYFLEDVATEFSIQGLELDWTCVAWDADFRYSGDGWIHRSFVGKKWMNIEKLDRRTYQKNAYRVLLTRARQGMVIVVPEGDPEDSTRKPEFYDSTYNYLRRVGFSEI